MRWDTETTRYAGMRNSRGGGIESANQSHITADKQRLVQDSDYWGAPVGTPIVPGMKPVPESERSAEPEFETPEQPAPESEPPPKLTDEEYEQHLEQVSSSVSKAIADGEETNVKYSLNGVEGGYTRDRRRQQRVLLDGLWHKLGKNVPREGKAVMAGGLGGAGKSTVLGKFAGIDNSQYLTVNPDDVKEAMVEAGMAPEVEGLSPMETAALTHEESSYLASVLANRAYEEGTNIIWDITMSSPGSTAKKVEEMREAGYNSIEAVFVDIPLETSVERAAERHRRGMEKYRAGEGQGGRYVPPEIIRKNKSDTYSSKNRETFENLKGQFDGTVVYDNSEYGRDPVKLRGSGRWASRRRRSGLRRGRREDVFVYAARQENFYRRE